MLSNVWSVLRIVFYAFIAAWALLLMSLFTAGCSIGIYRDWRGLPESSRTVQPEPMVKVWTARCEKQAKAAAQYGVTDKLRPEFIRLCVIEYARADFERARRMP